VIDMREKDKRDESSLEGAVGTCNDSVIISTRTTYIKVNQANGRYRGIPRYMKASELSLVTGGVVMSCLCKV